jgi:putative heme-binding domain-containing protein
MRCTDEQGKAQVKRIWETADETRLMALLAAAPKLPADNVKPYAETIHKLLKDKRQNVRQAATLALGHIGDASAVKDLVQLARRDMNPIPAVAALAGIDPSRIAEDQILIVATLLVETSPKAKSVDPAVYPRLLGAAQKFLSDPRVPTTKASTLRTKLMEPGVIYQYLKSDPIKIPAGGDATFTAVFPPEENPAGPFGTPFSAEGKEIKWSPLVVSDPKGLQTLEMPDSSAQYFAATIDLPADRPPGSGYLSTGSDDGLHVWLNGKSVINKNVDRGMQPDTDKQVVALQPGKNTLLLRVNNRTGVAGVQARLRTRANEFDVEEFPKQYKKFLNDTARGRAVFEAVGCVKCHTTDRHEEPRGPFLGDVGAKFDVKYICDSIMRPSNKIAQGFATDRIITSGTPASAGTGATDVLGFVTKETADEVQLRDPSGKVTIVRKSEIKKRAPVAGSMMPEGLTDTMTIDDFASLLTYLQSLK